MKSMVIISDKHCGSNWGLTPPKYWTKHLEKTQRESWTAYKRMIAHWGKPDILVVNGDAIEGTQKKQGGAELLTADRNVQSKMAIECIELWEAKKIFMTYGSKYHVGDQAEDFEFNIADKLDAKIEGRLFLKVEGLTFDIRHKVGTSVIPHGRATQLLRELLWDLVKEANGTGPKIDVVVRSHAHYHIWVESPDKVAFITPALQLSRGRFGSRECQGETHWGAIRLILHNGQIVGKDKDLCKLHANKPPVTKVE